MEKDKDILKQVGRDTGMRVPDGYFEGFTSRMVSQLDNFEVVELEKPTVWQRVRPWLYMAAMFAGIALMVRLFVPEKDSSSVVAETEVSIWLPANVFVIYSRQTIHPPPVYQARTSLLLLTGHDSVDVAYLKM